MPCWDYRNSIQSYSRLDPHAQGKQHAKRPIHQSGGTLLIAKGATLNNLTTISYVQTAGQTVVDGAIGIGAPAVQLQGGILSGTGDIFNGLDNVGGIVQPGDGGAPGTLFFNSYEQQSGATFDELIGSSGNGVLLRAPEASRSIPARSSRSIC